MVRAWYMSACTFETRMQERVLIAGEFLPIEKVAEATGIYYMKVSILVEYALKLLFT